MNEAALNLTKKNRMPTMFQQERDNRPAVAVIGRQRIIPKELPSG